MITCKDVWFRYQTVPHEEQDWVIRNLNLSITAGEYVSIIGPNGSGKSTLIRLLNGLLTPSQGTIQVGEFTTSQQSTAWQIRQKVGVVFQNPDHQIVGSTVQDDIAFGLENLGLSVAEIEARIMQVLEIVGLQGLETKDPQHLSGGQKQRLAIAGVLAMRPEVIIFDESTAMLDPQGTQEVQEMIQLLHKNNTTIIQITHDMNEAFLADRLCVFAEGTVQVDTPRKALLGYADRLAQFGLELPLHLQLHRELCKSGWPLDSNLTNQEELVREIWRLSAET